MQVGDRLWVLACGLMALSFLARWVECLGTDPRRFVGKQERGALFSSIRIGNPFFRERGHIPEEI